MASTGNYELLCLENPLLDIQGVGYVNCAFLCSSGPEFLQLKDGTKVRRQSEIES